MTRPMTNFEKTAVINNIVGNHPGADWETLKVQADLIQSELNEIYEAIEERNIEKARDGVGDVLFTAYGFGHRANFPTDEDFEQVCVSNLTKFDLTEEDAEKTRQKYLAIGVQTYVEVLPYTWTREEGHQETVLYYVTKSERNQIGTDGKDYPRGKYLKSTKFKEPVFREIPATNLKSFERDYQNTILQIGAMASEGSPIALHTIESDGASMSAIVSSHEMRVGAKSVKVRVYVHVNEVMETTKEELAKRIAGVFFHHVSQVHGVMPFIDGVTIEDTNNNHQITFSCAWKNEANIVEGVEWKLEAEGPIHAESVA